MGHRFTLKDDPPKPKPRVVNLRRGRLRHPAPLEGLEDRKAAELGPKGGVNQGAIA